MRVLAPLVREVTLKTPQSRGESVWRSDLHGSAIAYHKARSRKWL